MRHNFFFDVVAVLGLDFILPNTPSGLFRLPAFPGRLERETKSKGSLPLLHTPPRGIITSFYRLKRQSSL